LLVAARRGHGRRTAKEAGGVDQPDHAEGLRGVAELTAAGDIVFLLEQSDIVAQREQPFEKRCGLAGAADAGKRVSEPETGSSGNGVQPRVAVPS